MAPRDVPNRFLKIVEREAPEDEVYPHYGLIENGGVWAEAAEEQPPPVVPLLWKIKQILKFTAIHLTAYYSTAFGFAVGAVLVNLVSFFSFGVVILPPGGRRYPF